MPCGNSLVSRMFQRESENVAHDKYIPPTLKGELGHQGPSSLHRRLLGLRHTRRTCFVPYWWKKRAKCCSVLLSWSRFTFLSRKNLIRRVMIRSHCLVCLGLSKTRSRNTITGMHKFNTWEWVVDALIAWRNASISGLNRHHGDAKSREKGSSDPELRSLQSMVTRESWTRDKLRLVFFFHIHVLIFL